MAVLYAHRGASAECPENTLASFRCALAIGADALELDAHMSGDGHIVISHDPSAQRMCGIDREFRRATLDEIKSWDAGYNFKDRSGGHPFAGRGEKIPTLDDVLEEFPDVPLNIDFKQRSPSMVPTGLATIRRHRAEDRVTVASFRWLTLVEVRTRGYRGATSLSRPESAALLAGEAAFRSLPLTGTAAQLPTAFGPVCVATKKIVDRCHALGLRVDFWTVNNRSEAEHLLKLGADGIMTDDPRELAPAFGKSPPLDHSA